MELGKIVNLMSADLNNIVNMFYPFFNTLFSAPILIFVSFILLWQQIEWATFIGVAIFLVGTPLSGNIMKNLIGYRRKMLQKTDRRLKIVN